MGQFSAKPQNQYSLVYDTIDCQLGNEKVAKGDGSFLTESVYDFFLIQQLWVGIMGFCCNMFMTHYYATRVQHPKYCLRWQRKYCLILHIWAGTLETFIGPILSWWLTGDAVQYVTQAQAITSLVHCITALYQIPIVFGVHIFMVPAYFFCVVLKVVCAINVLLNPFCAIRVLILFNVSCIYSWCRIFIIVFRRLGIFLDSSYSVGIFMALAICSTGMSPAILLFFFMFVLSYIWAMGFIYGRSNWKFLHLLGESSTNPFDNSTFDALFTEAHGQSTGPFSNGDHSDDEALEERERDAILRPLFHHIDVDGNGKITLLEMKQFALNVKHPKLYKTIVKAFNHSLGHRGEKEPSMDYEEFRKLAQGSVYGHKIKGLREKMNAIDLIASDSKKNNMKARLVFDIIDKEINGYLNINELGVVLMEFGLPRSEVTQIFNSRDPNHDGKLEFEDFRKGFRPLWEYAYNVFRRQLNKENEIVSSREHYLKKQHSLLKKENSDYLHLMREKSRADRERQSRKSMKKANQLRLSTKSETNANQLRISTKSETAKVTDTPKNEKAD